MVDGRSSGHPGVLQLLKEQARDDVVAPGVARRVFEVDLETQEACERLQNCGQANHIPLARLFGKIRIAQGYFA